MYKDFENIIFPKIMFIGITLLIFISLFFVSENYTGWSKSAQTIDGNYKNKWLFDVLYFASLLVFINLRLSNFLGKQNLASYKKIAEVFEFNANPIYLKFIFYLIFIIYCLSMNITSSNSTRFLMEYQRSVFINFFLYIFLFYYVFLILGSIVLPIKGDK